MCEAPAAVRPYTSDMKSLPYPQASLRVVSVGIGAYPAPAYHGLRRLVHLLKGVGVVEKTFGVNTESTEHLRRDLFPEVATLRINDHFGHHGVAVDFIESDERKFELLFQCGRLSFDRHAEAFHSMLASLAAARLWIANAPNQRMNLGAENSSSHCLKV
jgi:hypothetical protein